MDGLASHADTTQDEQSNDRVKLKDSSSSPCTKREIFQDPTLADPVGDQKGNGERCGDRCSFEVFALSRGVLGDIANGDVEACESSQTTEDEEGEEEMIGWGTESNSEC